MNIGKAIREALDFYGVDQRELALKLNVTPGRVNELCYQESCTTIILDRIAKAFGIKTSALVIFGEQSTNHSN